MTRLAPRIREVREGRDEGRIMLLSIGYLLIAMLILTVVVAVTAVFLEHKRLLDVADRASSAAADSFGAQDVATRGGPYLGDAAVRRAAENYLTEVNAAAQFSEFGILGTTGAPDATTARVSLRAVVHPPLVNFIVPAGIEIEVESDSRIVLSR
ncbi:pilus assembly protein TadG-related protein [Haematomicrobium sanguinis]|uniref:pilus assembly protein TadG-related protein n=1 Tax=Haematomicrobium sanguinis TaxID=479106 RepID=UPI0009498541|nr:pilus assembly protein TadG-related protein [Haematomicrobium sanguinis]